MPAQIVCVVEGEGEREAVPVLLRRIAATLDPAIVPLVPKPLRIPKSRLLRPKELERAVDQAARSSGGSGAVLVLVDADDDCPAELGPRLLERAAGARPDVPVGVVLAKREFEGWFLAAAESLVGPNALRADVIEPVHPEDIRGAKEWLDRSMAGRDGYRVSIDQPRFAARFDLERARRAPSFDKCYREVARLLTQLKEEPRGGG